MFEGLQIERRETKREQIAGYVRKRIHSGAYAAGLQLPSTQALARELGQPEATVHRALSALVKEGLLSRKPHLGTMVNALAGKLEAVAVYMRNDLRHPRANFSRLLLRFLEDELNRRGVECLVVTENREQAGLQQLRRLAAERRVQAVIAPKSTPQLLKELSALPVPFSCMTAARIENRVRHAEGDLEAKAVEALRLQGCRKVGIISSEPDFAHPAESGELARHKFHVHFRELAQAAGMETRPEWRCVPGESRDCPSMDDLSRFGFSAFERIWAAKERPDGLFVCTDDLVAGVLLALSRAGARVPEDLKLALYCNRELPVFCPMPCVFVECSIIDMVTGLVDIVENIFQGRPPKPADYIFNLNFHKGD